MTENTPDTTETDRQSPEAYQQLLDRVQRLNYLSDAGGLLSWDQQVMMPSGGAPARAQQQSTLSGLRHELLTADETGTLLSELGEIDSDLADTEQAIIRETRKSYEEATRVPGELVEEISRTSSEAQEIWQQAKAEDEFEAFAPTLGRIRELQIEQAEHIDADRDPYRVMFEGYDPDLPLDLVEEILSDLREALVPLIDELQDQKPDLADPFAGETFTADTQEELSRSLLDELGYDWDHGRLDTSPHPFMVGNQYDARITTRFSEDDPFGAVLSTIHEFGHATYQLGLPQEQYGTPLGQSVMIVHESQSRFWENHVARTQLFWERYADLLNGEFDTSAAPRELYEAANRIYPENRIRVEADELTYHLHIILRTLVEKQFIAGEIDVSEIPAVWNETMDDLLGIRPDTDREGCLQDIHWTGGFANFQTYTVGSVLAAQLDAAMRRDLPVDEHIRDGEFDVLMDWMHEKIHRHGQRYPADELIERATGEPLTAEYFIEYAEEKFGELYGL